VSLAGVAARPAATSPFRVANRQGATLEGRYAPSPAWKTLLARLAAPCKWPAAAGAPAQLRIS